MKKIAFWLLLCMANSPLWAQVDTFSLNNMPGNYFLGDYWLNYDSFCFPNNIPLHSDGYICSSLILNYDALLCVNHRPEHAGYGVNRYMGMVSNPWDTNHILNFATGEHTDTAIRVVGVALMLPRFWGNTIIREHFLSQGYDILTLQLMDTAMNILAEGSSLLSDSTETPVFHFNRDRTEVIHYGQFTQSPIHSGDGIDFQCFYEIYEAYFATPVTVTDSFYLSAHYTSLAHGKSNIGIATPGIYEIHTFRNQVFSPVEYFLPKITWYAQGGYRSAFDSTNFTISYDDMVPDSMWFTVENCEENHGYMLIFPILEVVCGVPEEVTWNPMGGGNVLLRWEHGQWETMWEVSYGATGTPPGEGTVVETARPSVTLGGIENGRQYVAYVRSRCTVRDTMWSNWSDSVSIMLGGSQDIGDIYAGNIIIHAEDGRIVVEGAEGMEVKIYDMKGIPVGDRDLPAGVYMVRIGALPARKVVMR